MHPGRGARLVTAAARDWHCSILALPRRAIEVMSPRCSAIRRSFPVVVPPLPRTTTGYHLPALRVGFRSSRQNVQTPVAGGTPALLCESVLDYWHRHVATAPEPKQIADGGWRMEKPACAGILARAYQILPGMPEFSMQPSDGPPERRSPTRRFTPA